MKQKSVVRYYRGLLYCWRKISNFSLGWQPVKRRCDGPVSFKRDHCHGSSSWLAICVVLKSAKLKGTLRRSCLQWQRIKSYSIEASKGWGARVSLVTDARHSPLCVRHKRVQGAREVSAPQEPPTLREPPTPGEGEESATNCIMGIITHVFIFIQFVF